MGAARIFDVSVNDPYRDDAFERVSSEVEALTAMGYGGAEVSPEEAITRKRTKINRDDAALKVLISMYPDLSYWLDLVPTAAALGPLYNPEMTHLPVPGGHAISQGMRDYFRNLADAVGIRSRSEIMRHIVTEQALHGAGMSRWASLACGAAQPVFDAMEDIRNMGGFVPEVTLVDYDKEALALVRQEAMRRQLSPRVCTRKMNILRPEGIASPERIGWREVAVSALRRKVILPQRGYDVVDAVGLLEYLRPEDWQYRYNRVIRTRQTMAGAVTFLRNASELVKPGGTLLVGNMLDSHPQLGFTLNVIQWPHIQPRPIDKMLGIMEQAGLGAWETKVYCPDDGVYALYALRNTSGDVH